MTKETDDIFRKQLLETFREEAFEYLEDISQGLIILEKSGTKKRMDIVENIYRKTHSLKGAARAVNIPQIVSICQNLENIFSAMLKDEFEADDKAFDTFYQSIKYVRSKLSENDDEGSFSGIIVELKDLSAKKKDKTENYDIFTGKNDVSDNIETDKIYDKSLKNNFSDTASKASVFEDNEKNSFKNISDNKDSFSYRNFDRNIDTYSGKTKSPDITDSKKSTVRIASEKLDRLILGSDDLLTVRLSFTQRIKELENLISGFEKWHWNDGQIFDEMYKIRELSNSSEFSGLPPLFEKSFLNVIKFLDFNREFVTDLEHHLSRHIRASELDRSELETTTSEISDLIHDAVLLPFNSMIKSFPEYIRDISKSLGKEVNLKVEGGKIEIDRRILESLKDPMMHLIRNSIDHGIEDPQERIKAGKPPSGEIKIKIYTLSGSKVGIKISDDGRGIHSNMIKLKAVETGIITDKKASQISEEEINDLIFRSGLTTSNIITEISGRGIGLAIVADTISHLNGDIKLNTILGKGTEFTINLPLKLATFRGLVVSACEQKFVFPKQHVKKVTNIDADLLDYNLVHQTIKLEDNKIGVIRLSDALGIKDYRGSVQKSKKRVSVVIIAYGVGEIGFIVDEVMKVQEIIVRSLGTQLRHVKKISGAAILGDGIPALVLDPLELIEYVLKHVMGVEKVNKSKNYNSNPKHYAKILVVEDSVTSRQYILNMLKKRGYNVETASDGTEAFLRLKENWDFDLVVSDVDMPRMSGFTLTEKIRSESRISKIPVILITSLNSPEDKKQGLISGANAYITKDGFSEDNFISIVKNLLESNLKN